MIKHWAKLSCLVAFGHLLAVACTTEDDDDGDTTTTTSSTTSSTTSNSGGTGGDGGNGGNGGSTSTGTGTTTGTSTTAASGGTSAGGSAGSAGDGNEAGTAGAAGGGSTDGYDGEEISELAGPETVTNGSTITVEATIPGADEDQTFQVAVNGEAGENVTATPNDDGVFGISVSIPDDADGDSVNIAITPLDSDGDAGETADIDLGLIESGTGDVKVTMTFDQPVDLDLVVTEPSGEVIYWGNPDSDTGGTLDLDANRLCVLDKNIENIFWETDAPVGEYEIGVSYFSACEATEPVNVTITITRGDDVETFTDTFVPEEVDEESVYILDTFTVE
jgi:hypothetical protein